MAPLATFHVLVEVKLERTRVVCDADPPLGAAQRGPRELPEGQDGLSSECAGAAPGQPEGLK